MRDRGRDLEFGFFPVPLAAGAEELARRTRLAEELGYDLVAIQDHPYQRRYLDTFVLLPWLAATTDRIRLVPDVAHLPLRPPAMLAKAIASLDVLSGGRVELGLGAGGFPEASRAMGAPPRTPGELIEALAEAVDILRRFLAVPDRGIHHDGHHYRLGGVKAGPPPLHDIGIWLGGGGPRMLRLIGRVADGWIAPAARYTGRDGLLAMQAALDRAAEDAGRDPASIRRVAALDGLVTDGGAADWPTGPADHWVAELASLADHGFDTFVLWPADDSDEQLHAFAGVADAVRAEVGRTRGAG